MKSTIVKLVTVAIAFAMPLFNVQSAAALEPTRATVFRNVVHLATPKVEVGDKFVINGRIYPKKADITIQRQRLSGKKWINAGRAKTNASGYWAMSSTAPSKATTIKYRFITPYFKKSPASYKGVKVVEKIPDPTVSVLPITTSIPAGTQISFVGDYFNAGAQVEVRVNQLVGQSWEQIAASTTVGKAGWAARITVPTEPATYNYQIVANTSRGVALSENVPVTVVAPAEGAITTSGPGTPARIWGMDIARYQHMSDTNGDGTADIRDDGLPIDFAKAYSVGMRFVFIKASDGYVDAGDQSKTADDYALKFASQDRPAAQTAGIYTGLYHFPAMPKTENLTTLKKDARDEAIMAAARLAQLGGYTPMDLPYVLDAEQASTGRGIARGVSALAVTTWIKAWLLEMQARTGRMPILYTGPSFMQSYLLDDPLWASVPLWVAHYGCTDTVLSNGTTDCVTDTHNEAVDKLNAGRLPGRGWSSPYHQAGVLQWDFWQYSSRARGSYYGITNNANLDVNVFAGTTEEFLAYTQQLWQPTNVDDYQAVLTPINLNATYETAPADEPVRILVHASRVSNGTDVVSGQLAVRVAGAVIPGATVEYAGVGTWLVTLPPMPAETQWNLTFSFRDTLNYYAPMVLNLIVAVGTLV